MSRVRRCRPAKLVLAALGLAALAGCQQIEVSSDEGFDDEWEPPPMMWGEADTGDPPGEGNDEGEEPGDDDADTGPAKLDMPPGDLPPAECSLVDLLFVIDNSNSMSAEQANLIASFEGFITGIQQNLVEANDYHIGVVSTDAYQSNPESCRELGALVQTSAAGDCGPFAAGPYITLADELAASFTCVADVGIEGDTDERQIEAALEALSPALNGPGGCNEGFIREDALLVLVVITDEDDGAIPGQGSPGQPENWFNEIVEAKGVESNVVVLALAGLPAPNACNDDVPFEGAQIAWRIRNFVERFSYGQMGDVCADDYGDFFDASLEAIYEACLNFTPEG